MYLGAGILMPAITDVAVKNSSHSLNCFFVNLLVRLPSMTMPPSKPGAIRGEVSFSNAAVRMSFQS
jgi:hypothetical protein